MRPLENLGHRAGYVALACGVLLTTPTLGRCGFVHYAQLGGQARILAADPRGVIWFGGSGVTQGEDLSSFDGIRFSNFRLIGGGPGYQITEIVADRSGTIWIGSDGAGLFSYGDSLQRHDTLGGESVGICDAILEDNHGHLWFALTLGGVTRFDGSSWTVFRPAEGIGNHVVLDIYQDRSGNYWFGTQGNGISRFDGTNWLRFTAPNLPQDTVVDIAEDGSGNLWAATPERGVARFDGVTWRTFTSADGLASDAVTSVAIDPEGKPWFGTTRGLSRFDGTRWLSLNLAHGLRDEHVTDLLVDQNGNLWIAGASGVLSRFDRTLFEMVTPVGIPDSTQLELALRDRDGQLWFLQRRVPQNLSVGLSHFAGEAWTHFTQADGLPGRPIAIAEGRTSDHWVLSEGWLSRYDGVTFSNVALPDSIGQANSLVVDHAGIVWIATEFRGLVQFDGTSVTIDPRFDGGGITSLFVAADGRLWIGLKGGSVGSLDGQDYQRHNLPHTLTLPWFIRMGRFFEADDGDIWVPLELTDHLFRFDGQTWEAFTAQDHGLARVEAVSGGPLATVWVAGSGRVQRYNGGYWSELVDNAGAPVPARAMALDQAGRMWLDMGAGILLHEPDRVAPQTVVVERPPILSPNRIETISFIGVLDTDTAGSVEYSVAFNGGLWSEWSPEDSWFHSALPDGVNAFQVRARDFSGNIDATPATITFEIDGTPPTPVIAAPTYGAAVRGRVEILGTADDARFKFYELHFKPAEQPWDAPGAHRLARDSVAVVNARLGDWETAELPDGAYDLRLTVHDVLGLPGQVIVSVIVDNHAPSAEQTSPARIHSRSGGDVYTTNSEVHAYFPPLAFSDDVVVNMEVASASIPDTLPDGAPRLSPAYSIEWAPAQLRKPAMLEFSLAALAEPARSQSIALYRFTDTDRTAIGGSVLAQRGVIAARIDHPGRYAVFGSSQPQSGTTTVSSLQVTPRVFSPAGTFATPEVAISFALGRAGTATVQVFSRSGRLIREVAAGQPLQAGSNVVYWDGRDRDGRIVSDGMYLVAVEVAGEKQIQTLAVVR